MDELFIWMGILFSVTQSAMFSGLNLAFFSISKLELQMEASKGNKKAQKILRIRKDSNFLLTTILWGNVGINVLLTMLSNSVMFGVAAFLFSTIIITFFGEIIPQAYFSRNAMKMASLLAPILRIYQFILYPLAKPTAIVLDKWLGHELIQFYRESELQDIIRLHINDSSTEITRLEGIGALNFFELDDITVDNEGSIIDTKSIITIPFNGTKPIFPNITNEINNPFLNKIVQSRRRWVVLVDPNGIPRLVVNASAFIAEVMFNYEDFNPLHHCHRPIIINNLKTKLENIIPSFNIEKEHEEDDVIDNDVILVWADEEQRIITGADILGRLLRGVVQ